jgi:hypothetical protein
VPVREQERQETIERDPTDPLYLLVQLLAIQAARDTWQDRSPLYEEKT